MKNSTRYICPEIETVRLKEPLLVDIRVNSTYTDDEAAKGTVYYDEEEGGSNGMLHLRDIWDD